MVKPSLPTRKRAYKKKTEAEKRAEKLRKQQAQEKAQHLTGELENHFEREEKDIVLIAERTGYSVEYVHRSLKAAAMKRAQRREPTHHNAMVSFKIRELNKGTLACCQAYALNVPERANRKLTDVPDGEEKIDVKTFAKMAAEDPSLKEMTEDERKEAMDALLEKRRVQKVGTRGTTRGVTVEGLAAMGRIADTLHTINSHGGLVGFACVAKSDVNKSFNAAWAGTEGVPEFFKETFGLTMEEVLLLFELYECNRTNQPRTKNLPSLQKHCAKLIADGLQSILENQNVAMRYTHYERQVCVKHRVILRGWPEGIKFGTPYQLGRIDDAEKLRDALRSGECKWVKMKPDEYKELQQKVNAEAAPTRGTRSDKGLKRKRGEKENEDSQRPAKKVGTKKSAAALKKLGKQLPAALKNLQAYKSKEFIESDDDLDSEDGELAGQRSGQGDGEE